MRLLKLFSGKIFRMFEYHIDAADRSPTALSRFNYLNGGFMPVITIHQHFPVSIMPDSFTSFISERSGAGHKNNKELNTSLRDSLTLVGLNRFE